MAISLPWLARDGDTDSSGTNASPCTSVVQLQIQAIMSFLEHHVNVVIVLPACPGSSQGKMKYNLAREFSQI